MRKYGQGLIVLAGSEPPRGSYTLPHEYTFTQHLGSFRRDFRTSAFGHNYKDMHLLAIHTLPALLIVPCCAFVALPRCPDNSKYVMTHDRVPVFHLLAPWRSSIMLGASALIRSKTAQKKCRQHTPSDLERPNLDTLTHFNGFTN